MILMRVEEKGPTNDSLPSEKVVGSGKLKCNDGGQDPEFRSLLHKHVLERQSLSEVVPPSAISFSRRLPSIYIIIINHANATSVWLGGYLA